MNTENDDISRIYQQTRTAGPSASTDDAILAASRKAAAAPKTAAGPFSGRWPAVASIAAVIIITIILIPVINVEHIQQKQSEPAAEDELSTSTLMQLSEAPAPEKKKRSLYQAAPANRPVLMKKEDMFNEGRTLTDEPIKSEMADYSRGREIPEAAASAIPHERSQKAAADSAPFAIFTPEMWQVKISRLIEQGEIEAASRELEELKNNYPDFDIDSTLLEKLQQHEQP